MFSWNSFLRAVAIFQISMIQHCGPSLFVSFDEILLSLDKELQILWLAGEFRPSVISVFLLLIFALLLIFLGLS